MPSGSLTSYKIGVLRSLSHFFLLPFRHSQQLKWPTNFAPMGKYASWWE